MSTNNENNLPIFDDSISQLIQSTNDDSATKDFEAARANIQELVSITKEAISELTNLANQSQNPTAYATLAKLIDTGINAFKTLLDLQVKIRSINGASAPVNGKKAAMIVMIEQRYKGN